MVPLLLVQFAACKHDLGLLASWVSQDINSDEILVQKAVASYPLGASKNDKRVIRKNNTFLHV